MVTLPAFLHPWLIFKTCKHFKSYAEAGKRREKLDYFAIYNQRQKKIRKTKRDKKLLKFEVQEQKLLAFSLGVKGYFDVFTIICSSAMVIFLSFAFYVYLLRINILLLIYCTLALPLDIIQV